MSAPKRKAFKLIAVEGKGSSSLWQSMELESKASKGIASEAKIPHCIEVHLTAVQSQLSSFFHLIEGQCKPRQAIAPQYTPFQWQSRPTHRNASQIIAMDIKPQYRKPSKLSSVQSIPSQRTMSAHCHGISSKATASERNSKQNKFKERRQCI